MHSHTIMSINRAPEGIDSLAAYFAALDADRFRFLARILRDEGREHLAALAESWATEAAGRQEGAE